MSTDPPRARSTNLQTNVRALSSTILASTLFQSEMIYRTSKIHQASDFVISPISIRSLLTLISIGVIKNSHHELLTIMGLKSSHHGTYELKACKNANRDEFNFQIHNAIFMNIRLDFALSYRTICVEQYQTRIENVDFEIRDVAATNINNWISEQTHDRLETRIVPSTLRSNQDNLLINIAQLEARWIRPFPKKLSSQDTFWLTSQKEIQVNMMHDFYEVPFGELEDLRATAIVLPYKNLSVNLLILLPLEIDGLAKMEEEMQMRRLDITTLPMSLKIKAVNIGLPKVKMECEIEMEDVLKDMGIKAIFNESMDFARLLGSLAIMKIAQIKHIASIELNEDGTAASSTKVSFLLTEMKNAIALDINHPFFFAIMDQERIYFGGHINEESHFIS